MIQAGQKVIHFMANVMCTDDPQVCKGNNSQAPSRTGQRCARQYLLQRWSLELIQAHEFPWVVHARNYGGRGAHTSSEGRFDHKCSTRLNLPSADTEVDIAAPTKTEKLAAGYSRGVKLAISGPGC